MVNDVNVLNLAREAEAIAADAEARNLAEAGQALRFVRRAEWEPSELRRAVEALGAISIVRSPEVSH